MRALVSSVRPCSLRALPCRYVITGGPSEELLLHGKPTPLDKPANRDLRTVDHTALEAALGVPEKHLNRTVYIVNKAKAATQQGWGATGQWEIRFGAGPKWTNPLMGWLSGSDPMDYMVLHFKSKEAAIYHCITNGYNYQIEDTEHKWASEGRAYGTKFNHKSPKKSDSDLL